MEFDNTFEVPAGPDRVWAHMLDVEAVVPCVPGGELTEVVDDRTWKGKITVKLGAMTLSFKGTVTMTERDEGARRVVLDAKGMEAKGKGQATAKVTSTMTPTDDGGTRVDIHTNLSLSGQAAQMGRGMVADVSKRLTDEFADCVASQLTAAPAPTTGEAPEAPGETQAGEVPAASDTTGAKPSAAATAGQAPGGAAGPREAARAGKPVAGGRLALWAVWRAIVRGVRRLFGRDEAR